MDFEKFSKKTAGQINKELGRLLKEWRSEIGGINADLLPLVDKFIESSEGGKRLRGILVVLGYQLARHLARHLPGEQLRHLEGEIALLKVAAAYEIFHSAILAHDDVIDQSRLRRGQPSLHMALGGNHNGISQAICLGDAGFFLAVKTISESFFPDKEKIKAVGWFSKTMLDTAMGEMLDISHGDVTLTMKLKTAEYSVSGPLQIGAILGGVGQRLLGKLGEFGEALGIAFQIQDDILGVFGSEKTLGKSVTSDIEEGKNTLLYNYALKKSDHRKRQVLGRFYGKGDMGGKGLQDIKRIFRETGALKFAQEEISKYRDQALKILPKLTKDKIWSKLLEQMAEYLVERSR